MSKKPSAVPPAAGDSARRSGRWNFGRCVLDEASRELRRDGQLVKLEPKPLDLLLLLLRHAGELVTKNELIDTIWAGRIVTENVIARCVTKLREALGADGAEQIVTVHGYGYRFIGACQFDELLSTASEPTPLRAGDSPPGRPNWELETPLDEHRVWRARHRKTGQRRVFKFAHDSTALAALKREITLFRVLTGDAGRPMPVAEILDWNFEERPWFIELRDEPLGSLARWPPVQNPTVHGATPLTPAQRIELAARIADATAAAHALGVLHKDIKPGNLLLRANEAELPDVLLCDFGSGGLDARALEQLKLTRLGLTHSGFGGGNTGTALYIAPELLSGTPPTLRSDLYALGVLTYQLVVGDLRRPLAPGWERDIDDPLLREDIALAADVNPEHRLGDAAQFAERLRSLPKRHSALARRRALEQEREAALRAGEAARSAMERLRFRRRWQGAAVASLCIGLALSTGLFIHARALQRRATIEADTLRAVNLFVNDDLLGAADPYVPGGGATVTVASVLDTAAHHLHERFADQDQVRTRLALTLSRAYAQLGLEDRARNVLAETLSALTPARAEHSADGRALMSQLAALELKLAQPDTAHELYARLDRWTRTQLAADDPERLHLRRALAWETFEDGYFAQARTAFEALRVDVERLRPDDSALRLDIDANLVEVYAETHDWRLAESTVNSVLARTSRQHGENSVNALWPALSKTYILRMQERWDEAESLAQATLKTARERLGEHHPLTLSCYNHLGSIRLKQQRYAEARRFFEIALEQYRAIFGSENYRTRRIMTRLSEVDMEQGHADRARAMLQGAFDRSMASLGESHPHTLDIARLLAEAEAADGAVDAAEVRFRRVLELAPLRMPANNNRTAWTYYGLGRLLARQHRGAEAAVYLRQSDRLFRQNFGPRYSMTIATDALLDTLPPAVRAAPASVAAREPA
jgi:non-specific serine/threonine protein kinase